MMNGITYMEVYAGESEISDPKRQSLLRRFITDS